MRQLSPALVAWRHLLKAAATTCCFCMSGAVLAGEQEYAPLSNSVRAALTHRVSDQRPALSSFANSDQEASWLLAKSRLLKKKIEDSKYRDDLLRTIHYEATRAGLEPELVLGLIEVESNFSKYAISRAGARGYMQVMPFWLKLIGRPQDNLFDLRTNLRYGCTILRHYLDVEHGNLFRALGRYNGSLGYISYPNKVKSAWTRWAWPNKPGK